MPRSLAVAVLATAVLTAGAAYGGDHLVTRDAIGQRLADAQVQRNADLAAVREVLATPQASRAARAAGTDVERLKAAAATLSDAELADLAVRARALEVDPVAGLSADVNQLLIIFLIVAIVILVLKAVD